MSRKQNLYISAGSDFSSRYDLLDVGGSLLNVTGFTAEAGMKKWFNYGNTINFTCNLSNGSLVISMNSAVTSTANGRYVYEVVLVSNNGIRSKIADGVVYVEEKVLDV